MIGVLPVDKPEGFTSFDVIAKLRGILKIKRLGHSGTLDPMATGVLPVFIGRATRAIDLLPDIEKRYIAGFALGYSTDTQDVTGAVLKRSEKRAAEDEIKKILPRFTGKISQLPPMYSAVKVGGRRLYDIAREGKTVERAPREIEIFGLALTRFDEKSQTGSLEIRCSKGAYVRTLINDVGEALGTLGVMSSLRRTYSQGIDISSCISLPEIERMAKENSLEDMILPVDKCFESFDKLELGGELSRKYKNGQRIAYPAPDGRYRIYSIDGFLGLGEINKNELRAVKNFFGDD